MPEMDQQETEMDSLLRLSLSAPVPVLRPGFSQRLSRKVLHGSQPLNRSGRLLLTGYGVLSAAVSVVVMRSQGLGWGAITVMTLGPLVLVAATSSLRRAVPNQSARGRTV